MQSSIPVTRAKRIFLQLIREVSKGRSYVITSRGKPIATLDPIKMSDAEIARERFLRHLESQPVRNIGRWTRDDLYDDE